MELTDKVALVTGAGKRVGKAIALGLAQAGANVAVHYHSSDAGAKETASKIAKLGRRAELFRADLTEPDAPVQLIEQVHDKFGRIDVLVNSASAFQAKAVQDISGEDWHAVMSVNLRAPFFLSQQAARLMQSQGGGVIINIADIAGQTPWPRFATHSISKAGLIMLTRVLAKALAPDIRVNAIVPGPVLKPEKMTDERWERLKANLPLRRAGEPRDVAKVVVALIDNDFVTGAVWNVDGGDALVGSVDNL